MNKFRIVAYDPHGNQCCIKDFENKDRALYYWNSIGSKKGSIVNLLTGKSTKLLDKI